MPVPYYLKPKRTHLPEGHDDTLDPPEEPTDPAERSEPPSDWPVENPTPGGTEPPDAPIAPPPTDSNKRSLAPFHWPKGPTRPNRPLAETVGPLDTLDPDIAMWQEIKVCIWPFSGPPTVGVWPRGYIGIDNTSTLWRCTRGGEPGTWSPLGAGTPGAQGQPGTPGTPGTPGMQFISELVLASDYSFTGGGWTDPIEAQEVNGNGTDRYRVVAQGVFAKDAPPTSQVGYVSIGIFRSDLGTALNSSLDSLSPEQTASFYLEVTDVPTMTCSYWLMAYSTDTGESTLVGGARLITWKTPG